MSVALFEKYHKKINKEGILKSLLCGLNVGCSVMFAVAFITWMTIPDLFWLAIVAGVVTVGASTPLFYYKKYRPTMRSIARRVDDLGLEERLLTMTELQGDDSYIAQLQRQDAISALSKVSADLIKIVVSKSVAIAVSIVGTFSLGMTTVTTLSSAGVIKSGAQLWRELTAVPPTYYEVTYTVQGEGVIKIGDKTIGEGESVTIRVEEGASSGAYAEGGDDWIFTEWSDGYQQPERTDTITKDTEVSAVFTLIEGAAGNDGAFDEPDDLPPVDGLGLPMTPQQGKPQKAPSGQYEPSNQIYDNKTYYGDEYESAYDKILGELESDTEITEEQKDIADGYMGTIEADSSKSDE